MRHSRVIILIGLFFIAIFLLSFLNLRKKLCLIAPVKVPQEKLFFQIVRKSSLFKSFPPPCLYFRSISYKERDVRMLDITVPLQRREGCVAFFFEQFRQKLLRQFLKLCLKHLMHWHKPPLVRQNMLGNLNGLQRIKEQHIREAWNIVRIIQIYTAGVINDHPRVTHQGTMTRCLKLTALLILKNVLDAINGLFQRDM